MKNNIKLQELSTNTKPINTNDDKHSIHPIEKPQKIQDTFSLTKEEAHDTNNNEKSSLKILKKGGLLSAYKRILHIIASCVNGNLSND